LRNRNSSATIAPDGYVIPSLDQYGRRFRYTQVFPDEQILAAPIICIDLDLATAAR
jgi:hypothetical protein